MSSTESNSVASSSSSREMGTMMATRMGGARASPGAGREQGGFRVQGSALRVQGPGFRVQP